MTQNTYPALVTPLARVTRRKDRNGRGYVSGRMTVGTVGGEAKERTVRVFGPLVAVAVARMRKDVATPARVAYDDFEGGDGRGQTVRIVSFDG